jgi:hypothetical protein
MATMVSEQGEVVQRIDDDMEEAQVGSCGCGVPPHGVARWQCAVAVCGGSAK